MKTDLDNKAAWRRGGSRGGFSLVEVLIAIGILGLGLIMVACIFPVGADWTRQNSDETVAAQVARGAVALIQTKYSRSDMAGVTTTVQAIPGLTQNAVAADMPKLTIYERGFQLAPPYFTPPPITGLTTQQLQQQQPQLQRFYSSYSGLSANPTVNDGGDPSTAQFFWTALIRQTPSAVNQYDLYILVSRKGNVAQTFMSTAPAVVNSLGMSPGCDAPTPGTPVLTPAYTGPLGGGTLGSTRVRSTDLRTYTFGPPTTFDESFVPPVLVGQFSDIPMGSQAIGLTTGTVFRKIGATATNTNIAPANQCNEYFAYVPPADGTTLSPLVYIYQTKIGF